MNLINWRFKFLIVCQHRSIITYAKNLSWANIITAGMYFINEPIREYRNSTSAKLHTVSQVTHWGNQSLMMARRRTELQYKQAISYIQTNRLYDKSCIIHTRPFRINLINIENNPQCGSEEIRSHSVVILVITWGHLCEMGWLSIKQATDLVFLLTMKLMNQNYDRTHINGRKVRAT